MQRETRSARSPPGPVGHAGGARPKAEGERPGDAVEQRGHRGRPPSARDDRGAGTPASCRACRPAPSVESYRRRLNPASARADAMVSRVAIATQTRRSQAGTNACSSATARRNGRPPLRPCPRRTAPPAQQLAELEPAEHIIGESRDERFEQQLPIVDATRRARLDQQSVGNRQLGKVIEVRGARLSRAVRERGRREPSPCARGRARRWSRRRRHERTRPRRRASGIRARADHPRDTRAVRGSTACSLRRRRARARRGCARVWRSTDHVIESVSAARSSGAALMETCAIGAPLRPRRALRRRARATPRG